MRRSQFRTSRGTGCHILRLLPRRVEAKCQLIITTNAVVKSSVKTFPFSVRNSWSAAPAAHTATTAMTLKYTIRLRIAAQTTATKATQLARSVSPKITYPYRFDTQ